QRVRAVHSLDQQRREWLLHTDAPHRAARNDDIVAGDETQVAIVAIELAVPLVNEQQLIAVRVAHEVIHRRRRIPEPHAHVRVVQQLRCVPRRGMILRDPIEIERMRPQRSFEGHPACRWMLVVKEGRGPEEAFFADLPLVRSLRQVRMRLPRGGAFDTREGNAALHSSEWRTADGGRWQIRKRVDADTTSTWSHLWLSLSAVRRPPFFARPLSAVRRSPSEDPSPNLIQFDGFEKRLEVAFAEALVAFALNNFEEDRSDHVLRENLQQQPLALLRIAVDQNAALAQLFDLLAVAGHARIDPFVVRIRRILELNALASQHIDRGKDIVGAERDVLNAFALILAQVFLDLRLVVLRLVDRNANTPARARHRTAEKT